MGCVSDNDTGLAIESSLKSPNTPFEIAITGTSSSKTITITVDPGSGYWLFRIWLVDGSTTPNLVTLNPPSVPGGAEFFEVTNSSGVLTKTFEYSGARTWYPCATLIGPVAVGGAMAFA